MAFSGAMSPKSNELMIASVRTTSGSGNRPARNAARVSVYEAVLTSIPNVENLLSAVTTNGFSDCALARGSFGARETSADDAVST